MCEAGVDVPESETAIGKKDCDPPLLLALGRFHSIPDRLLLTSFLGFGGRGDLIPASFFGVSCLKGPGPEGVLVIRVRVGHDLAHAGLGVCVDVLGLLAVISEQLIDLLFVSARARGVHKLLRLESPSLNLVVDAGVWVWVAHLV